MGSSNDKRREKGRLVAAAVHFPGGSTANDCVRLDVVFDNEVRPDELMRRASRHDFRAWLVFGEAEPIVLDDWGIPTLGPPLPPPTFVPDPARERQIFLDSAMIELMARTDFSPAVVADRAEALWDERERRRRGA